MPVYNLCRICLTEDTNSDDMHPLFEDKNEECLELVQKIEECSGVLLKRHEEFPKMICGQCIETLNTSHKFRSMCQASEHALLDAIIKSEFKTEPQDNNSASVGTNSVRCNSQNDIFFDLRTEFINAEEVDLSDIPETANEEHEEHFTDIEENSNEFLVTTDVDDSDIEFIEVDEAGEEEEEQDDDDDDDDDDDEMEEEEEAAAEAEDMEEEEEISKRKTAKKIRKVPPPRKRGRPRLHPMPKQKLESQPKAASKRGRKKKIEETPTSIMCEICGNIYNKQSLLNMHMRRHLADKPYECEICSKTFACPSEIRRHMRVHTGEKPYVCKFCGRTFADRSTNIKHERIHTNERPFTCKTCGKSFTYSNVLKNHMLTHTGEKPFPCLACNKTFSRKHQLDQHCSTLTHQQTIRNLSTNVVELKDESSQDNLSSVERDLLNAAAVAEASE